jgi:hypothetical protein
LGAAVHTYRGLPGAFFEMLQHASAAADG